MAKRKALSLIEASLDAAVRDYGRISLNQHHDVKPKEDQIKCCLYRAFTDAGRVVHVEAAYRRNGGRCDLMILGKPVVAIEIKTAWAASGWDNGPSEQYGTWVRDIQKLQENNEAFGGWQSYFVLFLASQAGSVPRENLLKKVSNLQVDYPNNMASEPCHVNEWNGLDTLQYFIFCIT